MVILLLAGVLLTLNVRTPFWGSHENNGKVFTGIAASHLRLGLGYTKGQDVFSNTEYGIFPTIHQVPDLMDRYFHGETEAVRYGDHPPLLGLTEAAMIGMFGERYTVVRAVPIFYALFGLLLFYLLVLKLFDVGIARMAGIIYATFPMFAFFGRNVCHESPTLFYGLALLTGYVWWRDGGTRSRWWAALMVVSIVLGGGYGWPMYYLAGLLFAADWISRRKFDFRLGLLTLLPAGLIFTAVIGQIAWAFGGRPRHLVAMFTRRTGGADVEFGPRMWVERVVNVYGVENFGKLAVGLLPLVVAFLAVRIYRERFSLRTMVPVVLLCWGLLHMLLFREGAWVHAYWQFYLIPFVAIGLAWPVVEYTRKILAPAWQRSVMFVVAGLYLYAMNHEQVMFLYANTEAGVVPVQTIWQAFLG